MIRAAQLLHGSGRQTRLVHRPAAPAKTGRRQASRMVGMVGTVSTFSIIGTIGARTQCRRNPASSHL